MVAEAHSIQSSCRVLGVSQSTFFVDRRRVPSTRSIRHAWLTDLIVQSHTASRGTYGARRVHADLTLGMGVSVGHNAIEMLMARAGLKGLPGRKRRRPTHQTPTSSDLVERNFARAAPNELWVTDITEHPTREGTVYCAVVLDTFSRRVVRWSIDSAQTSTLVTNALGIAIQNRQPPAGTIIHSDHGTQTEFNWWSQHFDRGGVDRTASGVDEGVDGQVGDEVAGRTVSSSRGGARVLARDR